MLGRKAKAIDKDEDCVVDLIRFKDRTNRGENVGCLFGMESSNSRSERVIGRMEDIVDNDARFDEHYLSFLLDLEEFVEERSIEEDGDDPEYVMFLDNLKEWGYSYVLNESITHGVPSRIIYEVETIPFDKMMKRGSRHFGEDDYAQKENTFAGKINRKNTRSHGVNNPQKERNPGRRKRTCSPSDCYTRKENTFSGNINRRNTRSRGVNNTHKERNPGKRKSTRSPSDCYIQEASTSDSSKEDWIAFSQKDRNFTERNTRRNLRSRGVNCTKEKGTPCKSMKRKSSSSSSSSDCYIVEVRNSDFCGKTMSNFKKTGFYNRVKKSFNVDIQGKRTVGEVMERSKLISLTDNYVQEERNLNLNNYLKFGTESSEFRKIITKPDAFDYFEEDERSKKKKTISLNPDYFQEDEKTKNKKPISHSSDYLQKKQSLGVIGDSRSAPKKSSNEVCDVFMKNLKVNGQSFIYENGDNERACYDLPDLPFDGPLAIVPVSSKQSISVAATSSDKRKQVIVSGLRSNAPLPPTIRRARQRQPTHPSTALVLASRPTMPPLDKQHDNNLTLAFIHPVVHRVGVKMRKKLHEILSKPYSKEEHEQLWKGVSARSAVQIHRDSRSGGSDRPGEMGRSLLDWHPDVRREIEKVKSDPHKVLNLLRMFSFYIKKLPCGNICKPWMDDTITTILPGSS